MALSAKIVDTVQPDLLDINFGCPVKKVVCKGAGAGVLKDIDLMVRLTKACVESTSLPVTVKTRLGWDEKSINILEVAERLQDVGIKALTIHGRTRSQMYKGTADWNKIGEVKSHPRIHIPIFGNGDVDSPEKAVQMKEQYGVDGIMIGRASIGYPWIFNEIRHFMKTGEHLPAPSIDDRVTVCRTHLAKSIEWKGEKLGIIEMRRHYANYFRGLPNFKELRTKLVTLDHLGELNEVLDEVKERYESLIA
jgi:nifR3 family TIM-barrel protein